MRSCRSRNVVFLLMSVLCSGCIIRIGDGFTSSDDPSPGTPGTPGTPGYEEGGSGAAGPGQAPRLPEPSVWRVDPPQYTPEQEQRKQEVDAYLAEQLRGYDVIEAIQGYSGDITYWVKSDGLPQVPAPEKWQVPDLASGLLSGGWSHGGADRRRDLHRPSEPVPSRRQAAPACRVHDPGRQRLWP